MAKAHRTHDRDNRLLGALEPASRKRIDSHLEPITLELGAVVCEAGGLLKHAYFPQGNVLSLLTVLENGSAIETANIGREGAFGLFAAMYSRVSFNRCIVPARRDNGALSDRIAESGVRAQRTRPQSFRQLFGDPAVAGSTDLRMQCNAYDGGEGVPMAPHDA